MDDRVVKAVFDELTLGELLSLIGEGGFRTVIVSPNLTNKCAIAEPLDRRLFHDWTIGPSDLEVYAGPVSQRCLPPHMTFPLGTTVKIREIYAELNYYARSSSNPSQWLFSSNPCLGFMRHDMQCVNLTDLVFGDLKKTCG